MFGPSRRIWINGSNAESWILPGKFTGNTFMRYRLSSFKQNFNDLMRCYMDVSITEQYYKAKVNNTIITARANHLGHITDINIRTELSSGLFASTAKRKTELETHVKSYVMAVGSLIDMSPFEIQMMIANMMRTVPYSGKGIISEQHQITNGWEVAISIPITKLESKINDYNYSSRHQTVPIANSFDELFNAETFLFNMNWNLQYLESNELKITEINIGEVEKTPALFAQYSNNSIFFLQLEPDFKHFVSVHLIKMKDERIATFTQKELAALLCFLPNREKAASLFLDNFLNDVITVPVTKNGKTKDIGLILQHDPDRYQFTIIGSRV